MKSKPNWLENKQLLKAAFEKAERKRQALLQQLEVENKAADSDTLPELPPKIQALRDQVAKFHAHAQTKPINVTALFQTLLYGSACLTRRTMQMLQDVLAPSQAVLTGTRDSGPPATIEDKIRDEAKKQSLWVPVRAVNIDKGLKLQFARAHAQITTPPTVRLRIGGQEATLVSAGETGRLYTLIFDRHANAEGPLSLIREEDGWLIEMDEPE